MWLLLLAAAVIGAVAIGLISHSGNKAVGSYLGGMVLAVGAFEFGLFNIRLADRWAPQLTLAVAMFSYLMTALALALVLALSSPRIVDGPGISIGLGTGLCIWLAGLISATWVREEPRSEPVNIVLHDDSHT